MILGWRVFMRSHNIVGVLGLLLIAVFSLSTVFGVSLEDTHPKRHIDNAPHATQHDGSRDFDLGVLSPAIVASYLPLLESAFTDIIEHFHQSLSITYNNQTTVFLSAFLDFKQRLIHIFHKTIAAVRSVHHALSYLLNTFNG